MARIVGNLRESLRSFKITAERMGEPDELCVTETEIFSAVTCLAKASKATLSGDNIEKIWK